MKTYTADANTKLNSGKIIKDIKEKKKEKHI